MNKRDDEETFSKGDIDKDLSPPTDEQRNGYYNRFGCGGARASTGRFWTDEEYAARKERVLGTPLP